MCALSHRVWLNVYRFEAIFSFQIQWIKNFEFEFKTEKSGELNFWRKYSQWFSFFMNKSKFARTKFKCWLGHLHICHIEWYHGMKERNRSEFRSHNCYSFLVLAQDLSVANSLKVYFLCNRSESDKINSLDNLYRRVHFPLIQMCRYEWFNKQVETERWIERHKSYVCEKWRLTVIR